MLRLRLCRLVAVSVVAVLEGLVVEGPLDGGLDDVVLR